MLDPRRMCFAVVTLALLGAGCGHDAAKPDGGDGDGGTDAPVGPVDDGAPTRQACTSNFGDALTAEFGRLDGYLVAIVPPGGMSSCNDDTSHVHLQIRTNGMIYDVAIDATDDSTGVDDVHTTTRDVPLPGGGAWAEGWHTGILDDYISDGLHSTDLPLDTKAEIVSTLTTDLATANHISVYGTGYGPDGAHLVHRDGNGHDGLLVTEPLSNPAHVRYFAFTSQAF